MSKEIYLPAIKNALDNMDKQLLDTITNGSVLIALTPPNKGDDK